MPLAHFGDAEHAGTGGVVKPAVTLDHPLNRIGVGIDDQGAGENPLGQGGGFCGSALRGAKRRLQSRSQSQETENLEEG